MNSSLDGFGMDTFSQVDLDEANWFSFGDWAPAFYRLRLSRTTQNRRLLFTTLAFMDELVMFIPYGTIWYLHHNLLFTSRFSPKLSDNRQDHLPQCHSCVFWMWFPTLGMDFQNPQHKRRRSRKDFKLACSSLPLLQKRRWCNEFLEDLWCSGFLVSHQRSS